MFAAENRNAVYSRADAGRQWAECTGKSRADSHATILRLEDPPGLRYAVGMKMTFAIPDDVVRRFRKAVPAGERSAVVTDFLRKKLRPSGPALEAVCRRVNKLKALQKEMADWERFDDQAP